MKKLVLASVLAIASIYFMALRPAQADGTVYLGACLVKEVPEGENNCVILEAADNSFETCAIMRKLAIEQKLMVSQCSRNKEAVKAELNKLWNSRS
jgi:hypothetical protein